MAVLRLPVAAQPLADAAQDVTGQVRHPHPGQDEEARVIGRPRQPVSLLYITGTADRINPLEGGATKMASGSGFKGVPDEAKPPVREMVRAWVKLLGCAPEAKLLASSFEDITTVVYGGGRDGTEVIFTTIEGHGHIWPGGKSPLPEFIRGKATRRLNATDAVWEFFQAHPKPNPTP